MRKNLKRMLALGLLVFTLTIGIVFPAFAKTVTYNYTVHVGDKYQIRIYYNGNKVSRKKVKYKSSKKKVASVSKKGVVKCKKKGKAKITCRYKGNKIIYKLKVKN